MRGGGLGEFEAALEEKSEVRMSDRGTRCVAYGFRTRLDLARDEFRGESVHREPIRDFSLPRPSQCKTARLDNETGRPRFHSMPQPVARHPFFRPDRAGD